MRRLVIVLTLLLPLYAQVKIKHGEVTDKSKPVRRALEAWYRRNMDAFAAKDVAAIMALRTDDFHTVTPDGKTNTRADMEARTVQFLRATDHFISQQNDIGTIEMGTGCFPKESAECPDQVRSMQWASADIHQHVIRVARLADGKLHKIEASVTQRETWRLTSAGWLLYRVDNIRDGPLLVDGKRRR
jgi:hypothetical protein